MSSDAQIALGAAQSAAASASAAATAAAAAADALAGGGGGGSSSSLTVVAGGTIDLDNSKADGYLIGYKVTSTATIEGTSFAPGAYIFERDSSVYGGWTYRTLDAGAVVVPPPDVVAPVAGTLASSSITDTGATVTVTGASDAVALHATPYSFSKDNGATWTAYQSSNIYAWTGLTAGTAHQMRHRVRDAAGNVTVGTAITVTTSGWSAYDTLTAALIGADRTLASPTDLTTSASRALRVDAGAGTTTVTGGKLTWAANNIVGSIHFQSSGAPTGDIAWQWDYSNLVNVSSFQPRAYLRLPQTTGMAIVYVEYDATAGRRIRIASDNSQATIAWTPGPSQPYTWNSTAKTIEGIPTSGEVRIERRGQLLKVYINDVLCVTADFTSATYSGSPNLLTTASVDYPLLFVNQIQMTNFVWERYL
jgi:hypothetical protein